MIIELCDVSKIFRQGFWGRKIQALQGLSLTVDEGEILGYLGPNGAGKTTTIKILTNLIRPTKGEARVAGMPVSDERTRRKIGYLPEQPYFYHYLTAWEFVQYCASLSGVSRKTAKKRGEELLMRLGIWGKRNSYLRNYSRGMLQRLGLVQALIHDPEILILDEPMEALDPLGRRQVKNLIRDLKAGGKTIIFSTHILEDVEALCDRIAIIVNGTLRDADAVENILNSHVRFIEIQFLFEDEAVTRGMESKFEEHKEAGESPDRLHSE